MYRVLQIANYVIHVSFENSKNITNLHLQKILYYLQANELVHNEEPLFNEAIEKWRLGPVIPEVYHEYKEFGSQPIEEIATEIVFDNETFDVTFIEFNENDIDIDTRDRITPFILTLLDKNPFRLVDLTHEHTPWDYYRPRIEAGERGLIYSNEEIHDYFSEHPDKLAEVGGGAQ